MENKQTPSISIIMPAYNAERYLHQTLDSVLNQSFEDFELIFIDDGSKDNTLSIVKEYKKLDNRIKILTQSNQFAGAARNAGLSCAKGKWLAFLDADDVFDSELLRREWECAEATDADIVVCGGMYFSKELSEAWHHDALLRTEMIPSGSSFHSSECYEHLLNFTTPAPWNKLFKASFVYSEGIRFQECKRFNDAYFVEVAIALSKKIGIVPEDLVYYRTNNADSLQGRNDNSPTDCIEVYEAIKNKLEEVGVYESIEKSFRNLALSNFIYTLDSLKEESAFITVYSILKNKAFKEFGIMDSQESDYTFKYAFHQYEAIMKYTPVEFLIRRRKTKRKFYLFPFKYIEEGMDIVLYGAGIVGEQYYLQLKKTGYCKSVLWVDQAVREKNSIEVVSPEAVEWKDYNAVVIAVESKSVSEEIRKMLKTSFFISDDQIVWWDSVLLDM